MARTYSAVARMIDGAHFGVTTSSGGAVELAHPHDDGSPTGAVSPMEGLLVSLAGCLGMSVAPFLRRMQPPITGYEIHARGELTERQPRVYETITVEHIVTGQHLNRTAIIRAIELAEQRYCGASAMLSRAAAIERAFVFVEEAGDESSQ